MTVARRAPGSVSALSAQARMLYRSLLNREPLSLAGRAEILAESGPALDQLVQLGLVQETTWGLVAIPRAQVLDELLSEQATLLQRALDEVLSRQRRIRTLLEAGPDLEGDGGEQIHTVLLPAGGNPALSSLPTQARRELMSIQPGGQFSADVLEQSLSRAQACLDAGVRLRVVHQSGALAHKGVAGYLLRLEELGAWVRLRDNLPFRLLMIDREAAVCGAPGGQGEESFVIRGPRVMSLLECVFETAWVDATPLRTVLANRNRAVSVERPEAAPPMASVAGTAQGSAERRPGGSRTAGEVLDDADLARRYARLTQQQQLVLRYLAEGETDRMIARRIGVTARTVSRRIAEVYQELQVESRFQAGVVAHRLGLV